MEIQKIYEELAKKYGITAAEVEAEIQRLLTDAWLKEEKTEADRAWQEKVPRKGDVPTPEEFICFIVKSLKEGLERDRRTEWFERDGEMEWDETEEWDETDEWED